MNIWCYTYDAPVTSHFSAKNWVLHKPSHSWYDIQTLSAQKGFRVSSPDLLLLYSKKLIVWHDKVVTNNTFIFTSPHRAASSSGLNVDITSKIVSELIYLLYQVTFGGVKDNVSTTLLGHIQLPIHHIQSNNTFGIFLPIDKTTRSTRSIDAKWEILNSFKIFLKSTAYLSNSYHINLAGKLGKKSILFSRRQNYHITTRIYNCF